MGEDHRPDFVQFIATVHLDKLCAVASHHRGGISCSLGSHTIGGFNVVYELMFLDGVVWIARIPLPYNCFQPEEISVSYAATLKYVKNNSTIPVPQVHAYNVKSAPDNEVNATYILMERLDGHALPTLERTNFEPDPKDVVRAKKVHSQLTDIILQLASLKFDKIGSLQEDAKSNVFVGPYVETNGTAYPKHKAAVYNSLEPHLRGPFSSISDWYHAMVELNRKFAVEDPEEEEGREETIAENEILAELLDNFVIKEFENGPFVINHNDLTVRNILVDDELNITGILDFPGTVVPLASLCVFPWLFSDNVSGLVTDRDIYLDVFLNRECEFPFSALLSLELRQDLMESAKSRQSFELGLMGPYTPLVVPRLFEEVNNRSYDSNLECQRIADTCEWFKKLVPTGEDGLYSWQRVEDGP